MVKIYTPQVLCEKGTEHGHQAAFFAWIAKVADYGFAAADDMWSYGDKSYVLRQYGTVDAVPQLKWVHAVPNGGERTDIQGAMLKAEGVKRGVSDIFVPIPVRGKAGLFIEMKPEKGGVHKPEQIAFVNDMRLMGYSAHFAHGWLEARDILKNYMIYGE